MQSNAVRRQTTYNNQKYTLGRLGKVFDDINDISVTSKHVHLIDCKSIRKPTSQFKTYYIAVVKKLAVTIKNLLERGLVFPWSTSLENKDEEICSVQFSHTSNDFSICR
jgi:hypothetical protein